MKRAKPIKDGAGSRDAGCGIASMAEKLYHRIYLLIETRNFKLYSQTRLGLTH